MKKEFRLKHNVSKQASLKASGLVLRTLLPTTSSQEEPGQNKGKAQSLAPLTYMRLLLCLNLCLCAGAWLCNTCPGSWFVRAHCCVCLAACLVVALFLFSAENDAGFVSSDTFLFGCRFDFLRPHQQKTKCKQTLGAKNGAASSIPFFFFVLFWVCWHFTFFSTNGRKSTEATTLARSFSTPPSHVSACTGRHLHV